MAIVRDLMLFLVNELISTVGLSSLAASVSPFCSFVRLFAPCARSFLSLHIISELSLGNKANVVKIMNGGKGIMERRERNKGEVSATFHSFPPLVQVRYSPFTYLFIRRTE